MRYFDFVTRDSLLVYCGKRYRLDDALSDNHEDDAIVYGQKVAVCHSWEQLIDVEANYVLLGIPEDIGVRANMGRPGADASWKEFLGSFLNFQHTSLNNAGRFAIAGNVHVDDLMKKAQHLDASIHKDRMELSEMVKEVDFRVSEAISKIIKQNKIPIVIGGGHNNCYPIIRSFKTIDVINIDTHTDLRVAHGRHSGNGFSHALNDGHLNRYFMIGLQSNYLSQPMLNQLNTNDQLGYGLLENDFKEQLKNAISHVDAFNYGLEIDMDVVANFPSSAQSPVGYSFKELREIVTYLNEKQRPKYIHICEAAPQYGYKNQVGKALATLVNDLK